VPDRGPKGWQEYDVLLAGEKRCPVIGPGPCSLELDGPVSGYVAGRPALLFRCPRGHRVAVREQVISGIPQRRKQWLQVPDVRPVFP
jgi:hypothetical protein